MRRVVGQSMLPTLRPDRLVIGLKHSRKLSEGQLVIIDHDGKEKIKRIRDIDSARGLLYVVGDNPSVSTDSRHFGGVGINSVVAKIIWPRV